MNEKTTIYIEPDLKKAVKVELINDGENQSLSNLINGLLYKWLSEKERGTTSPSYHISLTLPSRFFCIENTFRTSSSPIFTI
ncbi:hypothetical protein [Clostridium sp.]|uniref:hypothetical protein n=1 Tax=Clostridium sp. TaxID=1506 RepID=UPI0035A1770A